VKTSMSVWKQSLALVVMVALVNGCGSDEAGGDAGGAPPADAGTGSPDANPLIVARPYDLQVPASYDASEPTPLVILLHGYSATGFVQVRYFGLLDGSQAHGYLIAYPEGLVDSNGKQFWNATDGCCNFDDNPVDDVAYLGAIIDDVEATYNVDHKRVFIIGHSNGGFMAHRLACELGDRIAAIVSLAGMTWLDPAKCPAADKVNVLQVHGDADDTIPYAGSPYYPSAAGTVATWATKNGCAGANAIGEGGDPVDLVVDLPGAETTKQSYAGCPEGGAVDFWTIHGGSHIPMFDPAVWEDSVWKWMAAHPKP
jgi:polyhydroxybutyrate depolymerase